MFRITTFCAVAVLASVVSAHSATVTLFDDNFNADSAGVVNAQTVTNLTNWNVIQGNVDVLDSSYGCNGCIDLDGGFSPAPAVLVTKQILNFIAGVQYTFQLFFSGGTEEELVTFSVTGALSFLAGNGASVFTVAGSPSNDLSSPMSIAMSALPNNFGPYLDRVLVTYDNGLAAVRYRLLPHCCSPLSAGLASPGVVAASKPSASISAELRKTHRTAC